MTFLIDKFFIEQFNLKFGTKFTYSEFLEFYKATRDKKRNAGLVNDSYKSSSSLLGKN